jgi:carbon-monoxide dehydrogenase large subunit
MHEPGRGRAPYIGRPLPRFEDQRLVAGRGRFTDDATFDGQAYAVFVRSPHPHARIASIDAAAARALPGTTPPPADAASLTSPIRRARMT